MQVINGNRSYIPEEKEAIALEEVLRAAAYTENEEDGHGNPYNGNHSNHDPDKYSSRKTVIITTINAAWSDIRVNDETKKNQENMVDMFLESLRLGFGTRRLIRHVVMGCMDQRSFDRCKALTASSNEHESSRNEEDHMNNTEVSRTYNDPEESKAMDLSDRQEIHNFQCVRIHTPGVDFTGEQLLLTSDYIKMMWRRIEFLSSVLELGYDFIFTVNPKPQTLKTP